MLILWVYNFGLQPVSRSCSSHFEPSLKPLLLRLKAQSIPLCNQFLCAINSLCDQSSLRSILSAIMASQVGGKPPVIPAVAKPPAAAPLTGPRVLDLPTWNVRPEPVWVFCLGCFYVEVTGFQPNPAECFSLEETICVFDHPVASDCAGCRAAKQECIMVCD